MLKIPSFTSVLFKTRPIGFSIFASTRIELARFVICIQEKEKEKKKEKRKVKCSGNFLLGVKIN